MKEIRKYFGKNLLPQDGKKGLPLNIVDFPKSISSETYYQAKSSVFTRFSSVISVGKNGFLGVFPNKKSACITKCVSCDVQECTSGKGKDKKFVSGKKRREGGMSGRNDIISFRVTKDEKKKLQEMAKEFNVSESEFLRRQIRQRPSDYPEIRILMGNLINEVNRVGVNINQIVKKNNAEFYDEMDKVRLEAYMRKICDELHEGLGKIDKERFGNR